MRCPPIPIIGADLPLHRRSTNAEYCFTAVIPLPGFGCPRGWKTNLWGAAYCEVNREPNSNDIAIASLATFGLTARRLFYGKPKITSIDEAGGVFQNPAVTPDATPTYCFPFAA